MNYYLIDVFGNKMENRVKSIEQILNTYRYFNSKDRIVSVDYKERYVIKMDRENKIIILISEKGNIIKRFKKNNYGKYLEI